MYPYPYSNSIPVIFFFFFFFFFLFLLFSLIRVCSLFLQDQNEIFLLVLSIFISLSSQRRKLLPSFLQATCLFHNLSSLFHSNIFLFINLWSFNSSNICKSLYDIFTIALTVFIIFNLTYTYSYFCFYLYFIPEKYTFTFILPKTCYKTVRV